MPKKKNYVPNESVAVASMWYLHYKRWNDELLVPLSNIGSAVRSGELGYHNKYYGLLTQLYSELLIMMTKRGLNRENKDNPKNVSDIELLNIFFNNYNFYISKYNKCPDDDDELETYKHNLLLKACKYLEKANTLLFKCLSWIGMLIDTQPINDNSGGNNWFQN